MPFLGRVSTVALPWIGCARVQEAFSEAEIFSAFASAPGRQSNDGYWLELPLDGTDHESRGGFAWALAAVTRCPLLSRYQGNNER